MSLIDFLFILLIFFDFIDDTIFFDWIILVILIILHFYYFMRFWTIILIFLFHKCWCFAVCLIHTWRFFIFNRLLKSFLSNWMIFGLVLRAILVVWRSFQIIIVGTCTIGVKWLMKSWMFRMAVWCICFFISNYLFAWALCIH